MSGLQAPNPEGSKPQKRLPATPPLRRRILRSEAGFNLQGESRLAVQPPFSQLVLDSSALPLRCTAGG